MAEQRIRIARDYDNYIAIIERYETTWNPLVYNEVVLKLDLQRVELWIEKMGLKDSRIVRTPSTEGAQPTKAMLTFCAVDPIELMAFLDRAKSRWGI